VPRIVQVVVTDRFAGVERYVTEISRELAGRGWDVTVVGGDPSVLPRLTGRDVRWLPGSTVVEAFRSVAGTGKVDVCHVHMTAAEAVGLATTPFHRAPLVSTRHFASRRGSSTAGRVVAPFVARRLALEIAISEFVASQVESSPDVVLKTGVRASPLLWQVENRVVLVLQRLEREKDTMAALRVWQAARLWEENWTLRVVGDGSERPKLEEWSQSRAIPGITFAGWQGDVQGELARTGVLLAPTPREALGLGVLEAMAAGVPVVAAGAGGHLETLADVKEARLFPPGDLMEAAVALRSMLDDALRERLSVAERDCIERGFLLGQHVDQLLDQYALARKPGHGRHRRGESGRATCSGRAPDDGPREIIVCSLEAWDEVWRRNQFLVDELLRRYPRLRVLFVEPAADPLHDLVNSRKPAMPRLRFMRDDKRLVAFRPLKAFPRRVAPRVDGSLRRQVMAVAGILRYSQATLWLNDVTYSPLIDSTGWPSVYDVTDDWLAAPASQQERERIASLEQIALASASEVVVCSPALMASRGATRAVTLIPNAVDVEHFTRPRPRPDDLPPSPVAVYAGTLHASRLDIALLAELAASMSSVNLALVGPDALDVEERRTLRAVPNITMLGPRPYADVPSYLQHADVVVVPHVVSAFTESLDPIKAYECALISVPTVATPVAGFRELEAELTVVPRERFVDAVRIALKSERTVHRRPGIGNTWQDRTDDFERVLRRVRAKEAHAACARG
jgi:glycosyltransferase involved in cell wall biosynthesis